MHEHSNKECPPDTSVATSEADFREASSILDGAHGFGGALWDAEMLSAFDGVEEIRKANDADKSAIFQNSLHKLREGMVAEIEKWAPRYVQLAAAYPQFACPNTIEWVRDRMHKVIDTRLRKPNLDGAVAFVLMIMSGGDVTEKHTWIPPRWMCSPDAMSFTIRQEHGSIARRLDHALDKTLARLKIDSLVEKGLACSPGDQKEPSLRGERSLKSALRKMSDPDQYPVMRCQEVMAVLQLSKSAVYDHDRLERDSNGTRAVLFKTTSVLAVKNLPPE